MKLLFCELNSIRAANRLACDEI